MKKYSSFLTSEFSRFLLAGGTAAVVNYISRAILGNYMSFSASIVVAYFLGMTTAFILFRFCVFSTPKQPLKLSKQIPYFFLVNGFAIVQILIVSILVEKYALQSVANLFIRQEIAHFMGLLLPAISSFYGHKYLTYR